MHRQSEMLRNMLLLIGVEAHTRKYLSWHVRQGVSPNAVRSMRFECQNKYFLYGPKSWLIRALLYTYINKIIYNEILLSWRVVYCVSALPRPYSGQYAYVQAASQAIRSKNSFRIRISTE